MGVVATLYVLPPDIEGRIKELAIRHSRAPAKRSMLEKLRAVLVSTRPIPTEMDGIVQELDNLYEATWRGKSPEELRRHLANFNPEEDWVGGVDKVWDIIGKALSGLVAAKKVGAAAERMLFRNEQVAPTGELPVEVRFPDDVLAISRAIAPIDSLMFETVKDAALDGAYLGKSMQGEYFKEYAFWHFNEARKLYAKAAAQNRSVLMMAS